MKNELQNEKHEHDKVKAFARVAPHWLELFKSAPVPVKKRMLAQIIDKIVLDRKRIEIHYNVNLLEMQRTAGVEKPQKRGNKIKGDPGRVKRMFGYE